MYRLIKTYPNSPPIGTELHEVQGGYKNISHGYFVSKYEVENYPEFWERNSVKTCAFKTLDGVDIYDKDPYWKVDSDYVIHSCLMVIPENSFICLEGLLNTFSTKKAAEKYVYDNKPSFSRRELINALTYEPKMPTVYAMVFSNLKEKLDL